jgi:hypothetical protein
MAATNGSSAGRRPTVPAPPATSPARHNNRSTKVNINKLNLIPDLPGLPPLTFSYNKTVVHGSTPASGARAMPGAGFTSDEDIRAFCEALRKQARPRAVERALDAEVLESALRQIPDVNGSLAGARMRARRVTRHLRRIAAAEKLIAKQAAALWSTFTREYEAEIANISRARARTSRAQARNTTWKAW